MKKVVSISRADAAYFSYLTYELKGYQVLMRLERRKEFCEKIQELTMERAILADELVKKYIGDNIKVTNVVVNLTYQRMEAYYE